MKRTSLWIALFTLMSLALAENARADIELPSVIGDGMVLQRDREVPVWGWDTPNIPITVSFRGKEATGRTGLDGKFIISIPAGEAGGPFELTISGSNKVVVKDVLVGEVWVAGGQSNMWWMLQNCKNASEEIAASEDAQLRYYEANTQPQNAGWRTEKPARTIKTKWQAASPATVKEFAATAYFFARDLRKKLGVPVGIVHVAVPGSEIEAHLSPAYLKQHLPYVFQTKELRTKLYPIEKKEYEEVILKEWEAKKAEAEKAGEKEPKKPREPRDPSQSIPGGLYNGTIHPVIPFGCKGFIWWQGEANANRPDEYRFLFPALIEEWRREWKMPSGPFLFVELHNFGYKQSRPVEEDPWPSLRDAQAEALRLPNVYRVCALDVMEENEGPWQIHPAFKQRPGNRLFLTAMANVYGEKDVLWTGPIFDGVSFKDGKATISFSQIDGDLKARTDGALTGFAIAGSDRVFYAADAAIVGKTVVLQSENVPAPVAVRYAWANHPVANLSDASGIPAAPFRSDRWILEPAVPDTDAMSVEELAGYIDRVLLAREGQARAAWSEAYKAMLGGSKDAKRLDGLLLKESPVKEPRIQKALKALQAKLTQP